MLALVVAVSFAALACGTSTPNPTFALGVCNKAEPALYTPALCNTIKIPAFLECAVDAEKPSNVQLMLQKCRQNLLLTEKNGVAQELIPSELIFGLIAADQGMLLKDLLDLDADAIPAQTEKLEPVKDSKTPPPAAAAPSDPAKPKQLTWSIFGLFRSGKQPSNAKITPSAAETAGIPANAPNKPPDSGAQLPPASAFSPTPAKPEPAPAPRYRLSLSASHFGGIIKELFTLNYSIDELKKTLDSIKNTDEANLSVGAKERRLLLHQQPAKVLAQLMAYAVVNKEAIEAAILTINGMKPKEIMCRLFRDVNEIDAATKLLAKYIEKPEMMGNHQPLSVL